MVKVAVTARGLMAVEHLRTFLTIPLACTSVEARAVLDVAAMDILKKLPISSIAFAPTKHPPSCVLVTV